MTSAKNTAANSDREPAPSFEQSLARLAQIVSDLEDGPLGLAESLARYEEGIRCLKQCYGTLEQAERKIELLAGVDAQGQPVVEPMTDEALSLEEKAQARSRRRSRSTRSSESTESTSHTDSDEADEDNRRLF